MSWFVYIVRCRDESLYIGITNNLSERITLHNGKKGSQYLTFKLPVQLIYSEQYPDKSTARLREIQLKGWTRSKKEKLAANSLL